VTVWLGLGTKECLRDLEGHHEWVSTFGQACPARTSVHTVLTGPVIGSLSKTAAYSLAEQVEPWKIFFLSVREAFSKIAAHRSSAERGDHQGVLVVALHEAPPRDQHRSLRCGHRARSNLGQLT
jgi:hypothetical protein